MQKWKVVLGVAAYLLLVATFFKVASFTAIKRADHQFGDTINLVEMLPYLVSVVGYMAARVYYFILVSSVIFLVAIVLSRRKKQHVAEQISVWCLALNVVVVCLCWAIA
ncbi:MAG: hypothetical protein H6585_12360 [Flavobacteriales bacterium]|nr:hypothetical protein [Flavobacteriales bacterium]MCB9449123.1 hypothetical protein [Flavobacteriales bacterium]